MTKGVITVNKEGKRNVTGNGKIDLSSNSAHGSCCCCKPYLLGSFTTISETWNLTLYQGNGIVEPNRYWRLTNNYTSYVPIKTGCVNKDGKLAGLPNSISPDSYKYTWVFRLEIGCKDSTGNYINWPDGSRSSIYSC